MHGRLRVVFGGNSAPYSNSVWLQLAGGGSGRLAGRLTHKQSQCTLYTHTHTHTETFVKGRKCGNGNEARVGTYVTVHGRLRMLTLYTAHTV